MDFVIVTDQAEHLVGAQQQGIISGKTLDPGSYSKRLGRVRQDRRLDRVILPVARALDKKAGAMVLREMKSRYPAGSDMIDGIHPRSEPHFAVVRRTPKHRCRCS